MDRGKRDTPTTRFYLGDYNGCFWPQAVSRRPQLPSTLKRSQESFLDKKVLFARRVRQCQLARRRRVIVGYRFRKLACGQVPLHSINGVVEMCSSGRLGIENFTPEKILHNQGRDAAMILRRVGW